MFCKKCGTVLGQNEKFCKKCGTAVETTNSKNINSNDCNSSYVKTQVSITVLKESFFSNYLGNTGRTIFQKKRPCAVNVYIDSDSAEPIYLVTRNEPFYIDIEPGKHTILFQDANLKGKKLFGFLMRASTTLALGAAAFGMSGSLSDAASWSGSIMSNVSRTEIKDNVAQIYITEGDVVKLSCKPNFKGEVKVSLLS